MEIRGEVTPQDKAERSGRLCVITTEGDTVIRSRVPYRQTQTTTHAAIVQYLLYDVLSERDAWRKRA